MLDDLFSSPRARARSRRSWLREPIDDYLEHLAAQRFNRSTLRLSSYSLLSFGEFTATQGVRQFASLPQWVDPFVAQIHALDCRRRKVRRPDRGEPPTKPANGDWGEIADRAAKKISELAEKARPAAERAGEAAKKMAVDLSEGVDGAFA